jgi:hypothetical protein
MNDFVTAVLDAATDPDLAGGDAERLRERLARAGLLSGGRGQGARTRPAPRDVARARAAAARATPLSRLITEDR